MAMTGMTAPTGTASRPRWDGRRILFEVTDGDQRVACAISLNALQDLSQVRRFSPPELLKCFAAARQRIEAIAIGKLRGRSNGVPGLLNIWSDDIDELPPSGQPAAALARPLRTG
jgi:hypothetical protein